MRGFVADRQEYRKPKRTPRTSDFREAFAGEEWPAPAVRYVPSGLSFADHGEAEDEFINVVPLTDEPVPRLRRLYEFRGGLIVEEFLRENLRQNPSLADVLIQAHGVIRGYFRSGTRIILEVVTDPEAPADQQLFVIVRTRLPRKIARELLSIVERGWWRSVPLAIRKKVELDVE